MESWLKEVIKQCDGRNVGDAKKDECSSPAMKKRPSTCKLSHVAMLARPNACKVGVFGKCASAAQKDPFFGEVTGDQELSLIGYSCPCPTTPVNTGAVPNSSAVLLFLLLVVAVMYVPASSAKRKRKASSDGQKGRNGRPFSLTCAPLAAALAFYLEGITAVDVSSTFHPRSSTFRLLAATCLG